MVRMTTPTQAAVARAPEAEWLTAALWCVMWVRQRVLQACLKDMMGPGTVDETERVYKYPGGTMTKSVYPVVPLI